jgi:hypothetical protein
LRLPSSFGAQAHGPFFLSEFPLLSSHPGHDCMDILVRQRVNWRFNKSPSWKSGMLGKTSRADRDGCLHKPPGILCDSRPAFVGSILSRRAETGSIKPSLVARVDQHELRKKLAGVVQARSCRTERAKLPLTSQVQRPYGKRYMRYMLATRLRSTSGPALLVQHYTHDAEMIDNY